ncbi:glutathione S-transferase family protein [Methylomagnum sp.]
MKLYETPRTRSARCRWVLQELGVPFEAVSVNLSQGEQKRAEFLKLNPYGRVPVLVDGELVLSESVAICLYLADKYADRGLAPTPGTAQRAVHDQWLLFCATELEQPLWQIRRHTALYPAEQRLPAEVAIARANFQRAAAVLDGALRDKVHLAGTGFSIADIVVAHTLLWAAGYGLLGDYPGLEAYLNRHRARDSCPEELRR